MFTILSSTVNGNTIDVSVEYTLNDGTLVDCDVPVFMPQSTDDVLTAVSGRGDTEQTKYDQTQLNLTIINDLNNNVVNNLYDTTNNQITMVQKVSPTNNPAQL